MGKGSGGRFGLWFSADARHLAADGRQSGMLLQNGHGVVLKNERPCSLSLAPQGNEVHDQPHLDADPCAWMAEASLHRGHERQQRRVQREEQGKKIEQGWNEEEGE